ncbi:MAG: sialate O-acetylesterase [Planctomycetota bacterium]
MRTNTRIFFVAALMFLHAGLIEGQSLKLGAPFSEHMMVQADAPVRVWGRDTPGGQVKVTFAGNSAQAQVGPDGAWRVDLPAVSAAGPHTLEVVGSETITFTDVVAGDLWWCSGQSNMGWPVKRSVGTKWVAEKQKRDPMFRLVKLPLRSSDQPDDDFEVQWQIVDGKTAQDFSGVAYFFGRNLRREVGRPIGLIQSAWGGSNIQAWLPMSVVEQSPMFEKFKTDRAKALERYEAALAAWKDGGRVGKKPPFRGGGEQHRLSGLYNAMTQPVFPLSIRGVIWYQGESNAYMPEEYANLFRALVAEWRQGFENPDLPVYYVQLPKYKQWSWIPFRDMQRRLDIPHTDVAVIVDKGLKDDIHPPYKIAVGDRLARLARAHVYGQDIVPGGPRLIEATRLNDGSGGVRLRFDRVGDGLASAQPDRELYEFSLSDAQGKGHNATAMIVGLDTVEVRSDAVTDPVEVRHGHYVNVSGQLINSEKLPASPFIELIGGTAEPQ